jgi:hypothetical protein
LSHCRRQTFLRGQSWTNNVEAVEVRFPSGVHYGPAGILRCKRNTQSEGHRCSSACVRTIRRRCASGDWIRLSPSHWAASGYKFRGLGRGRTVFSGATIGAGNSTSQCGARSQRKPNRGILILWCPDDRECHGFLNRPALTCCHGMTSEGFAHVERFGNQPPPFARPSVIVRPLPDFPRLYPAVPPSPQGRGCLAALANRSYAYNVARFSCSGKRTSSRSVGILPGSWRCLFLLDLFGRFPTMQSQSQLVVIVQSAECLL